MVFLVPVLLVHDQTMVTLALGAAFFFLEMTEAPVWAVPIDVAPRFTGVAGGIMSTAAGLAAVISPVVFGVIIDATGNFRLPFALSIALMGAGIALSFFMRPDRPIETDALSSGQASGLQPEPIGVDT